ncbi:MAG: geranyl transferase [Candidatus Diapherotrites archaeon]|uniref:Geranyl transferase n=1 Tax=Candidatus Iainarchaeum sp. TaxID=3101447 RepID=A0A2D6LZY0_9ARCH|nr:geranyl transferase [Candidatus Diapherotrites archaeon]
MKYFLQVFLVMDIKQFVQDNQELIEAALEDAVPAVSVYPEKLHHAIHYSLFDGAKRIRPVLAIAVAESLGYKAEKVLPAAVAIELAHTGSIILDDLPCVDNSDERRGKAACHKAFGESTAILAACSLLDRLYAVIVEGLQEQNVESEKVLEVVKIISGAIGSGGVVVGQFTDIELQRTELDAKQLEFIHKKKTASMFVAVVDSAAVICEASAEAREALRAYAENLGIAFQLKDDLLDKEQKNEINAVKVYGEEKTAQLEEEFTAKALSALEPLGEKAELLEELATYLKERQR